MLWTIRCLPVVCSYSSLLGCCQRSSRLLVARRPWSSSPVSSPPMHTRLLLFLTQRFYDVEMLLRWKSRMKRRGLQKKNAFVGQSEWFRVDRKGKFKWDFLSYKDTPLEEADMSYTIINYIGLSNLEGQKSLRTLSLRGCSEVDDWFLARLHVFQDSLKDLDISHCPRITTGGLAALRNLKGLRRLDVSALPGISTPGLVIILLEEMLPHCEVIASGYDHSLEPEGVDEERSQG
ncbi:distal membrane-arm assembly complex protein 2 isoform X3 [Phyllopteryx taeniolatus]|uniref:distal membrane-arm assembly complex protein 2 isoform X3 n=1 Tax=Phyllopteryx taeniolatus TaxID=161469 RepID=UPI002AD2555B|nr:distal membrane-arm assembly complex protein 2 isoform X3 [Phyllopteryx taeniolatus]